MHTPTLTLSNTTPREEEFITIVAPTIDDVMQEFHTSDLASQGYSIAGRVGRHKFSYAEGTNKSELFEGVRMFAATFTRTLAAS